MKLWQIKNILSDEPEIFARYYNSFEDYQATISDALIIMSLEKSNKIFLLTDNGNLRLTPSNADSASIIEKLSALETFNRYGGAAMNEVIDYGSYKVHQIK